VTIILTDPTDIPLLQNILYTYAHATGAKTKNSKSEALLWRKWNTYIDVLGIPYVTEARILEITYHQTINKMWSSTLHIAECLAHESYIIDVYYNGYDSYVRICFQRSGTACKYCPYRRKLLHVKSTT
jgi:hypothetical protein